MRVRVNLRDTRRHEVAIAELAERIAARWEAEDTAIGFGRDDNPDEPLDVRRDEDGGWTVHLADGTPIGRLPAKGDVPDRLARGMAILLADQLSVTMHKTEAPRVAISLELGNRGATVKPLEPSGYSIGLVGESNYQDAIATCREGDPVRIVHETGNPYDRKALAVLTADDRLIGYVPRDSFVRGAVFDEDKGCRASISRIAPGGTGMLGVVLMARLTSWPIEERRYPAGVDG